MSEGISIVCPHSLDLVALEGIYTHYRNLFRTPEGDKVEFHKLVSAAISKESKRTWGWRYILSVKNGKLQPSRFLSVAIEKHWKRISAPDIPEPVMLEVQPINGSQIPKGSQVLMASACVQCGRPFISNHPRRCKCFLCSPYKGRKDKR